MLDGCHTFTSTFGIPCKLVDWVVSIIRWQCRMPIVDISGTNRLVNGRCFSPTTKNIFFKVEPLTSRFSKVVHLPLTISHYQIYGFPKDQGKIWKKLWKRLKTLKPPPFLFQGALLSLISSWFQAASLPPLLPYAPKNRRPGVRSKLHAW